MAKHDVDHARPWRVIEHELTGLLARVDLHQFQTLLDTVEDKGKRWFFSGQGRSGLIAKMTAMRFMHAGYDVHVVGEATAPSIRKGDGLMLICGSGRTPMSAGFAATAKAEGATLVLVTHKPESPLATMADCLLTIPMTETVQFGGTLFEQGCLVVFDTLALHVTREEGSHAAMWRRHTNMQ